MTNTALITGASSGMGKIFAEKLAQRGMHTILVARSEDKLQQLAHQLEATYNTKSLTIPCDLSLPNASEGLYNAVMDAGWSVDWLINNAGMSPYGNFETMSPEAIEKMLMIQVVNLTGLTRSFVPHMLEHNRGQIVNVASAVGYVPMAYFSAYAAAKAFIIAFSEALWAEYRQTGVSVFTLSPGVTRTAMIDELPPESPMTQMKGLPAEFVVDQALQAIDRGQMHLITGGTNKMLALMPRLLPRQWVARIVTQIAKPKAI